jgi:hypothetical protein
MVAQVVTHADDFLEVGRRIGLTGNVMIVLLIHHGDEVEAGKVTSRELAGTVVEGVAMPLSTLPHTAVRQLTYMPGAYASGVNQKLVIESTLRNQVLHDAVSGW